MTGFRLRCPDCEFSSVVTGGWQDALDVAEGHAAGCQFLPADSVVTIQRLTDGRGGQVAGRSD